MLNESLREGFLFINRLQRERLRKNHPLRYLFWESTLNCNFFCDHCGSSAGRKVEKNELTESEIKAAFSDIAANFNSRDITIAVTGGEPLLRKDLFSVMKYAHGLGFRWGMVSNGYLLDKKVAAKLKDAGMSTAVISIDGIGRDHDDFRKMPGAYNRALEAIQNLAELNFVEDLQITTTVTAKSINKLEEMYQEFSKLPIHSWRVMNVDPIGRAELNKELMLGKKQFMKLLEFIESKRRLKSPRVTYDCTGFLGDFEGKVRGPLFQCLTGITVGSILHDGDIFVCPNVPRRKELIQGNVRRDKFSRVWEEKYQVFRDRNRTSCAKCTECAEWDNCLGNGFHLWDFEKQEPKLCHLEMIEKR